jgi:formylmethanofuran dehydrogenase subunit E
MRKAKRILIFFLTLSFMMASRAGAGEKPEWLASGQSAIDRAMSAISLPKGDRNILVLTNAGYGSVGNQSTEAFLDTIQEGTGCTLGSRSLLPLHTAVYEPLWCSLCRKDTGKIVFLKWTPEGFDQQMIEASPAKILTPEGWKKASSGLIGQRLFSVVSISLAWSHDPPWTLLKAAAFHDHFCPGVNSGYIAGQYLLEKLPLGRGDQYAFVASLGKCAADALQVMFNTTAGKSSGYAMAIGDEALKKYEKGGIQPAIIALRVNKKSDRCEGMVLGFDWNKAYADAGVSAQEIAPKGGPGNPMFGISRVKMAVELARMPKKKLFTYVTELKRFCGKADLVDKVAGGDPYAAVWNQ